MINHSPMFLGLAALVLAACAMVAGSNTGENAEQAAGPTSAGPTSVGLTCALRAEERAGAVTLRGELQADAALAGSYDLRIRRGAGLRLDQGGAFNAQPGQVAQLGQAQLSGRAADYDTALTVTVAGGATACPLRIN